MTATAHTSSIAAHAERAHEVATAAITAADDLAQLAQHARMHRDELANATGGGKALADLHYSEFARAFGLANPPSAPDDGPTGADDLLGRYGLPSAQDTYAAVLAAANAAEAAREAAQHHHQLLSKLASGGS